MSFFSSTTSSKLSRQATATAAVVTTRAPSRTLSLRRQQQLTPHQQPLVRTTSPRGLRNSLHTRLQASLRSFATAMRQQQQHHHHEHTSKLITTRKAGHQTAAGKSSSFEGFGIWQFLVAGFFALATSTVGMTLIDNDPDTRQTSGASAAAMEQFWFVVKDSLYAAATSVTGGAEISFYPRKVAFGNVEASPPPSPQGQGGGGQLTESKGKPYDISVRAIRGSRFTMEDEFFVGNGGRFAAVFDGHGGSGVSQYLKESLYNVLSDKLQEKAWEEDLVKEEKNKDLFATTSPLTVASHASALRAAFDKVEEDVMANDQLEFQGSTAVAIVLHEDDQDGTRTLLSANVGDSRAVLSRNRKSVDLTHDHKPNDEREKARIMALGETIEWDQDCKVHRVRNLSLARAIGDRYAKPYVSGEVEIKHFPIQEQQDEFVVLASDGLWDVMTSQAVVDYVHAMMDKELSRISKDNAENYKFVLRRNMAKFLAREAIRKGSADNVSVLMVWL